MLKTIALVMLSIPVLLVGALASSSCVVVDVKPADGPRIIVPVPLFVARAALSFAPEEALHHELPEEVERYSDVAMRILEELEDGPDGVLVEVRDGSDYVHIEKIDGELKIDVTSDDEEVAVRLPIETVVEILESCDDDEVDVASVLKALGRAGRTDLVHVRSRDEEVKVWLW